MIIPAVDLSLDDLSVYHLSVDFLSVDGLSDVWNIANHTNTKSVHQLLARRYHTAPLFVRFASQLSLRSVSGASAPTPETPGRNDACARCYLYFYTRRTYP